MAKKPLALIRAIYDRCGDNTQKIIKELRHLVEDGEDAIINLISYADKAMYHAKNSGKNAIYFIDNVDISHIKDINFVKIGF